MKKRYGVKGKKTEPRNGFFFSVYGNRPTADRVSWGCLGGKGC